jgi:hypothetical protein
VHLSYAGGLKAFTLCFAEGRVSDVVHCLEYLLRHLPNANSRKEILFLHELFPLRSLMSENAVPADQRVCAHLGSKHAAVAQTTAGRLQRTSECASLLLQSKGLVPHALAAALESLPAHWEEAVRRAAPPIVSKKRKGAAHSRSEAVRCDLRGPCDQARASQGQREQRTRPRTR